jgi:hypothetical protein
MAVHSSGIVSMNAANQCAEYSLATVRVLSNGRRPWRSAAASINGSAIIAGLLEGQSPNVRLWLCSSLLVAGAVAWLLLIGESSVFTSVLFLMAVALAARTVVGLDVRAQLHHAACRP